MNKDWNGNKKSTYATLGASNHSTEERAENDYYATPPLATEKLLGVEKFNNLIYEVACGGGHISEVLKDHGHTVVSTDLINRGYKDQTRCVDFLKIGENCALKIDGDIVTNPPYKYAKEFIYKSMEITKPGAKIAMLLKLTFLESEGRADLFQNYPPKKIYVFTKRITCSKNGAFEKSEPAAVCYAWFIWENGNKEKPIIDWV